MDSRSGDLISGVFLVALVVAYHLTSYYSQRKKGCFMKPQNLGSTRREPHPFLIDDEPYVLLKATAGDVVKWQDANIQGAKLQKGKVIGIGPISDGEVLLLSLCLYKGDHEADRSTWKAVEKQVIRGWPNTITQPLIKYLKKISKIGEEETRKEIKERLEELQSRLEELEETDSANPTNCKPDGSTVTSAVPAPSD